MRKTRKFRPTAFDHLESRTVLSTGMDHPAAVAALANNNQGVPSDVNQNLQASDYALQHVYNQYNQFVNNYRQARQDYFDAIGQQGADTTAAYQNYQSQVRTLADNLSSDLGNFIFEIPGGGLLQQFLRARLSSSSQGSLSNALTSIQPVGTTDLTPVGFATVSEQVLSHGLLSTTNLVRFYDATLRQVGSEFQNGTLRQVNYSGRDFRNKPGIPTGPETQTAADSVINQVNSQFAHFATTYRTALVTYFQALDNVNSGNDLSALQDFRNTIVTAGNQLSNQVTSIINAVPGGAPLLAANLQARLGSVLPGSLVDDLTTIPPVASSSIGREAFFAMGNDAVEGALLSTQNYIRLYDNTLRFASAGFSSLVRNPSLLQNRGLGGNLGGGNHGNNDGAQMRAVNLARNGGDSVNAAALGGGQVQASQYYGGLYNSYFGFGGYPYNYYRGFYGGGQGGLDGYPSYGGLGYPYGTTSYGLGGYNYGLGGLGYGFGGYYF